MADLRVGGLARFSTVDWPDRLTATVFLRGCPWRCPYCHNPDLLTADGPGEDIPWADVLAFLEQRRGLLDGVVVSGGEPTAQRGLSDALDAVRALGFAVGLHTGGPWPDRLAAVLPPLDWVGFDVKAPFEEYAAITGVPGSGERARDSLRRLIASGVPFEARTTVHPALLEAAALDRLADDLAAMGVRDLVLQHARPTAALPTDPDGRPFPALSADRAAAFTTMHTRA
ncbi:anaerobic ribonucleoside-triphosphate reductase activating protein [Rhodospira trueperi]|uniref:Pyruvate formate lyase activating enzyme n=1 Tax=Rhodospira trueperi TaxID=69960 RepID=A0A1G7EY42_9PROT|nr:anaerobic ribonucleoside-triphosphate reductase activating protein [Rhodospira trueperi]SDE68599.1 pyruvate formate lyase activating enzyme [Rhodospira trueperi]